jgi:hypothetical protein
MTTEAGKRLLAWRYVHRVPECQASNGGTCTCDAPEAIAAIEAEAVAAERERIVRAVEGLGWSTDAEGTYCSECFSHSKANGHLAHCPYAAVLAIVRGEG